MFPKQWIQRAHALLDSSLRPPHHELNEVDWKLDLSTDKKRIAEHLSAFANHPGGGYLAFGIRSDGHVEGVTFLDIETIVGKVSNLGRDALEPPLQLDHATLQVQDESILLVYVPESSVKPVHRRGEPLDHAYIRSGGTTRLASRQEVGLMMVHSKTPHWEDLHATILLSDDEILETLDIEPIFEMLERPVPRGTQERLAWLGSEFFVERHPAGGGYITNLGAVSAAKQLAIFPELSRKAARVVLYRGLNKVDARLEREGKYGYALSFQSLIKFVGSLPPQSEVIEQALRQKRALYPELALRKLIANALIHQDFSISGTGPLIEIFDDRIEISNPGMLLPSKTLDRLIGSQPESRNEKLARAYRRYKICEERGSGLLKAGIQIELYGLPPIRFEQIGNHFKVSLFAPRTFAQMSASERLNACYQHTVLRYLSSSVMTNKSLRERLKMPEKQRSMVSVLIQEAVDLKLIAPADPASKSKKFAEYIPSWAGAERIVSED